MTKKSPAAPTAAKPVEQSAKPEKPEQSSTPEKPEKPAQAAPAGDSSLFLDRIEEGVAVLLLGDKELHLPRTLLPAGAQEGDFLKLTLSVDAEATAKAKADLAAKRSQLSKADDGGDFAL
jgi:hypothetical protein